MVPPIGAVWRDFGGMRRYTVLVNVSGDEQAFTCGEGAARRTFVIPPRSMVSDCEMADASASPRQIIVHRRRERSEQ